MASATGATFQMAPSTYAVPMSLFRDNRQRVCAALRAQEQVQQQTGSKGKGEGVYVLLAAGKIISFNDTDVDYSFRQESYFQYCFGVKEPDCYGVLEVATGRSVLFVPRLPDDYATWLGHLRTLEQFRAMYETDEVRYVDELDAYFAAAATQLILTLSGTNSDSGLTAQPARFDGIEKYVVNCDLLFPVIAECRVYKSAAEVEVLRYVARVSSNAHIRVMRYMRPGRHEYEAASLFQHYVYSVGGCRHVSYACICCTGHNASILHYGHDTGPTDAVKDGDMCLYDMGGNYCGYAADITCSYPANGKFTDDQKFIYNAVLDARNAVLREARDGVSWVDMHQLASRVLLERLLAGGMLQGDVNEMLAAGLAGIFQPHGLGHLLGLDVHDVGGYLPGQPERPSEPWLSRLRFARVLKAGMYVTVEPGCYFIDWLMDRALADENLRRFIVVDVFERFRKFGGVRIEDDVLIKEDGNENFAIVPRTVEDIEAVMSQRVDDLLIV